MLVNPGKMNEAVEGCHIFPTPLRAVEVEINNGNLKKVYQYNSYHPHG